MSIEQKQIVHNTKTIHLLSPSAAFIFASFSIPFSSSSGLQTVTLDFSDKNYVLCFVSPNLQRTHIKLSESFLLSPSRLTKGVGKVPISPHYMRHSGKVTEHATAIQYFSTKECSLYFFNFNPLIPSRLLMGYGLQNWLLEISIASLI